MPPTTPPKTGATQNITPKESQKLRNRRTAQSQSSAPGLVKHWRSELRSSETASAKGQSQKARAFVHSLGLKSRAEWSDYCRSSKKPTDIPADPSIYAEFWLGRLGRLARDWHGRSALASI